MRLLRDGLLLFFLLGHIAVSYSQPASTLRSGPMVGYSNMTEVMIWAQTTKPANVRLRYWVQSESAKQLSAEVRSTNERANVAHVVLTGLTPGKHYAYELLIDGAVVPRPYPLSFQTQSLWQWRTDPPDFTVAIGSCFYINETDWDRPGKPYGSDEFIVNTIVDAKPDAMIWVGDNTYYREVDWNAVSGLVHRWTHTRSFPGLQALLGSVHHYFIWDDHDFGPNDADRSYRLRKESLEVHRLFTANHTYGLPETPGAFGRFEWADVEFILLDDRYHRSPNRTPDDDPEKTMWGAEQLQWLKDVLVNSSAPFKVVVNGNQVLNPIVEHEGLAHFRREYEELLWFIRQNNISGVVFISGDRHMSELIALKEEGAVPLYDFTTSSLTAGLAGPRGPEIENPHRVNGTLVADAHSFGLIHVKGPRNDRVMTLECRDAQGKTRWTHEIRAKELTQPRKEQ